MPLHDHFHQPVVELLPWETMHTAWIANLTNHLNARWLGEEYVALEESRPGNDLKIDIATYAQPARDTDGAVGILTTTWTPAAALAATAAVFPDHTEVRVMRRRGGRLLVAAIELLSPSNMESPEARRGFVGRCLSLLQAGASVALIDVVTECHFNLHNDIVTAIGGPDAARLPPAAHLYAAAYRPVLREGRPEIDIWAARCAVGQPLPTMPLRLTGDHFIPVEFELTYADTCSRRKLT